MKYDEYEKYCSLLEKLNKDKITLLILCLIYDPLHIILLDNICHINQ